jgi:very-short-patch-repair endonuclease
MENFLPYLYLAFAFAVIGGLLLLALLSKFYKPKQPTLPYVKTPLLTEPELRFFSLLESTLPNHCYLLAQVRLANLVTVKPGLGFSWKYFNPIGMKCVDFVVCDHATMRPLLVVELDDRSHDRVERQVRDKFVDRVLSSAGIPILHWPTKWGYNSKEVAKEVQKRLAVVR